MFRRMQQWTLLAVLALVLSPGAALAITTDPFGTNGQGGTINGQLFEIGSGGVVFELDAFVNIAGEDLNGGGSGTSAQLSDDPLPAGLDYSFSSTLSGDGTDIVLSYELTNNTGADISDLFFASFLDAEIDESINTFFNEVATTSGVLAAGQNFEADEPGFLFGDIVTNLKDGALDGTNAFPPSDDVSMAISFDVALLAAGETALFEYLVSEDGDSIGTFFMTQSDTDPGSDTLITFSAQAFGSSPGPPIPEPSAGALFAIGLVLFGHRVSRRR